MPRRRTARPRPALCTCAECSADRSRARIAAFTLTTFVICAALLFLSIGE